jgi:uncharacterized membrane protein
MDTILFFALLVAFYQLYQHTKRFEQLERQLKDETSGAERTPFHPQVRTENVPSTAESRADVGAVPHTGHNAIPVVSVATPGYTPPFAQPSSPTPGTLPHTASVSRSTSLSTPPATNHISTQSDMLAWFSENILIKIGAFLFFLGAVWFVSYAISQGWISPSLRIFFGILLGIAVCAIGWWRRSVQDHHLTLTALGTGIIIASVYAGQFLFRLFDPTLALVLLLCAIAYAVYVSVSTKQEWLTVLAALAALVAPLLVNSQNSDAIVFLTYLLCVSTAFLAIVFMTDWRRVTLLLISGVSIFLVFVHAGGELTSGMLWCFVMLFMALFYAAATISMWRDNRADTYDVPTLGLTVLNVAAWTYILTTEAGTLLALCAAVAFVTSYAFWSVGKVEQVSILYAGVGFAFTALATALFFDGYTETLVFILESGLAILASLYLKLSWKVVHTAALTWVLPTLLVMQEFGSSLWDNGIVHGPALAVYGYVVMSALIGLHSIHRTYFDHDQVRDAESLGSFAGVFAGVWYVATVSMFYVVWNSISAYQGDIAIVPTYLSMMVLSIGILLGILAFRLPVSWFASALATIALPLAMSLFSFGDQTWETSWLHLHAYGLYLVTAGLCFTAILIERSKEIYASSTESLTACKNAVWIALGIYLVSLVWLISHALFGESDTAVSVALFVYTVSGLALYMVGRDQARKDIRIAGITLLMGVVARLLLVDVWDMSILGRTVTFLGVGLLFIITALVEKPFEKIDVSKNEE